MRYESSSRLQTNHWVLGRVVLSIRVVCNYCLDCGYTWWSEVWWKLNWISCFVSQIVRALMNHSWAIGFQFCCFKGWKQDWLLKKFFLPKDNMVLFPVLFFLDIVLLVLSMLTHICSIKCSMNTHFFLCDEMDLMSISSFKVVLLHQLHCCIKSPIFWGTTLR